MLKKISRNIAIIVLLFLCTTANAITNEVTKSPTREIYGKGPTPYNYRIIDENIHAGGHPLNPNTAFSNTDEQALAIIEHLKSQGVETFIDLEKTGRIQKRYKRLLKEAEIKRIHVHMHAFKVPNDKEWEEIKEAFEKPVYLHCKWGADRTGSVIGRYLVEEKEYSPQRAYEAVISGGSHSGYLGGLKQSFPYRNLKHFIWVGAK